MACEPPDWRRAPMAPRHVDQKIAVIAQRNLSFWRPSKLGRAEQLLEAVAPLQARVCFLRSDLTIGGAAAPGLQAQATAVARVPPPPPALLTPLPQVAIIELPFGFVSSEKVGGAGGTCVIRGCVPKKLFVYA